MNNVEITRFLLEQEIHGANFPAEEAVRAKAFEILELFIQEGWDPTRPLGTEEPFVLR